MRVNILLVFVLSSQVAADLIHKAVNETQQMITLSCREPVDYKVTWSVERNGSKVDILTTDGDNTMKHIKDPHKNYNIQNDRSLVFLRVGVSNSGKYFCNNKSAVDLTVIPSGTKIQTVKERKSTTLKCPNNVEGIKPSWSREIAGKQEQIRVPVPPVGKKLSITNVQLNDSGLYFCDGKPAVYLNVTTNKKSDEGSTSTTTINTTTIGISTITANTKKPEKTSTPPTTTTATTTKTNNEMTSSVRTNEPEPTQISSATSREITTPTEEKTLFYGLGAGIVLILLITTVVCITWRRQSKKQETYSQFHVYDEVATELQPTNGLQSSEIRVKHRTAVFPDESNPDDHTYSTIPDLLCKNTTESPYSLAGPALCPDNNEDSSQLRDDAYFFLDKPKAPEEQT